MWTNCPGNIQDEQTAHEMLGFISVPVKFNNFNLVESLRTCSSYSDK